jgi:hypothetical protein
VLKSSGQVPRSGNYRGGFGFHGVLWQLWLPRSTTKAGCTALLGTAGLTGPERYGYLSTWQADLAAALTARGRPVQVTPEGITVTPPAAED